MRKLLLLTSLLLVGCSTPDYSDGNYNGNAVVVINYEGTRVNPLLLLDSISDELIDTAMPIKIDGKNYGLMYAGECKRITIPAGIYEYQANTEKQMIEYGFETGKTTYLTIRSQTFGTSAVMMYWVESTADC